MARATTIPFDFKKAMLAAVAPGVVSLLFVIGGFFLTTVKVQSSVDSQIEILKANASKAANADTLELIQKNTDQRFEDLNRRLDRIELTQQQILLKLTK